LPTTDERAASREEGTLQPTESCSCRRHDGRRGWLAGEFSQFIAWTDGRDPDKMTAMRAAARRFLFQQGLRRACESLWASAQVDALEGVLSRQRICFPREAWADLLSLIETRGIPPRQNGRDGGSSANCAKEEFHAGRFPRSVEANSEEGPPRISWWNAPNVGPLQNLPKDVSVPKDKLKQVEGHHQLHDERRTRTTT